MLMQIICIFLMPAWRTTSDSVNDDKEVLNFDEYVKIFPYTVSKKNDPNLRYEASRARLVVIINNITLADAFLIKYMMNCKCYHFPSVLPTREINFLRYCTRNSNDGSWTIVDFPSGYIIKHAQWLFKGEKSISFLIYILLPGLSMLRLRRIWFRDLHLL
ncbi:hypothetical protein L1987_38692 [Smallanthus sonchifolius]|uniref:Uncharacterized protein n=1 Tax=Smallanthus sonchifolius TaxID=185202 RepID=A0ACB9HL91_9ASTR|nr:hypothetical protein L1987_38692 [Smallanthus sonchifolius]